MFLDDIEETDVLIPPELPIIQPTEELLFAEDLMMFLIYRRILTHEDWMPAGKIYRFRSGLVTRFSPNIGYAVESYSLTLGRLIPETYRNLYVTKKIPFETIAKIEGIICEEKFSLCNALKYFSFVCAFATFCSWRSAEEDSLDKAILIIAEYLFFHENDFQDEGGWVKLTECAIWLRQRIEKYMKSNIKLNPR